eukprot:5137443-Amphidinium_carterae.3
MSLQELQVRWQELLRNEGKEVSYQLVFCELSAILGVVLREGASYDQLALELRKQLGWHLSEFSEC